MAFYIIRPAFADEGTPMQFWDGDEWSEDPHKALGYETWLSASRTAEFNSLRNYAVTGAGAVEMRLYGRALTNEEIKKMTE